MIIAVASGKGGTGKTTIAAGLAIALSEAGIRVSCQDCDVEAPNAHLFLKPLLGQREEVSMLIPEVDADVCTGCGLCSEVCEFNAIATFGRKTLVFSELCHGCGGCTLVCPEQAITEVPKQLGVLDGGSTEEGILFSRGKLNVGEPMAVPVISQLIRWGSDLDAEVTIRDAPPGSSCPVVETLRGADFVLLVTEPTPFGLHDLKLAVELTKELNLLAGVIINRDGIGDSRVEEYCQAENLPILLKIPFDREIGEGIAQGKSLPAIRPEYVGKFHDLYQRIQSLTSVVEVQQ